MKAGAKRALRALLFSCSTVLLYSALYGAASNSLDAEKLRAVAAQRYGAAGQEAASDWLRLIALARDQPLDEQLSRVNDFFNGRTRFVADELAWHQSDYWATPLETIATGLGDCEDFAIAKYMSLRVLGIPQSRLRLIYVRALVPGSGSTLPQAHMVLGYFPAANGEPRILDNLVGEIEWASARTDLTPVFSFNDEGLWAGNIKAPSDPTARLSRWRDVLARLREEGFP
ncbi:MAG: transglutaminase-like cysteine peptidase [Panacagrimonas sp.]